jgi:hypothetical protein
MQIDGDNVARLVRETGVGEAHFSVKDAANQGRAGVEQATIVGLVFGTIFAITRRIWMLMVAHAAFDLTAVAIIYWDLERAVAEVFFTVP